MMAWTNGAANKAIPPVLISAEAANQGPLEMPAAATATNKTHGPTASGHFISQSRPDLLVTKSGTATSTNNETHGDGDSGTERTPLTIRLSDAEWRWREAKAVYLNHRIPSLSHRRWYSRDRSNRLLGHINTRASHGECRFASLRRAFRKAYVTAMT